MYILQVTNDCKWEKFSIVVEQNEQTRGERKLLLVFPVKVAPLPTEVLYAGDGVLHELRAKWELLALGAKTYRAPHLQQSQPATYPAVNLHVDGAQIAVGSADVDELNQRSNTDALRRRGKVTHIRPKAEKIGWVEFL